MPLTLTTLPVEIITEILRLVQHGPSLASVAQTCECLCSIAQNIIVCEVNLTSARQTEQFITTMYNNHSRMAYVRALRIKSSEASLFPSRTPEVTASLLQQLASIIKKTKGLQELVITSRDLSWSTHAINDALSTCNNLTKLELISKAMKDLPHSTLIALRNLSAPVEVLVIGRVNYQPIHIFQVIKNFTSTLKSLTLKSCIIRPLEDLNLKWPKVHSLFLDAVTLLDVSVETAFPNVRILRVERIQYLFLSLDDVRRFTRWKAVSFVRTDYLTMAGMDLGACKIKQFHLDANGTHLVRDRSQFDLERFLTGHNLEYLRVLFYWGTPEDFVMLQHLSDLCNMVCFLDLTATIYMTDKLSEHPISSDICSRLKAFNHLQYFRFTFTCVRSGGDCPLPKAKDIFDDFVDRITVTLPNLKLVSVHGAERFGHSWAIARRPAVFADCVGSAPPGVPYELANPDIVDSLLEKIWDAET